MSPLYRAILWRRNEGLRGLFLILMLFFGLYAILFPGILSIEGLAKFTQNWFPLALVSMAQALLMLTGGINLATGATVSLGAVIAATTMDGPLGVAGGILAVIAFGALVGAASGAIVALLRLPAIIVTLALSFILGGIALLILPRPGGSIPVWFSDFFAGEAPTAALFLVGFVVLWKLYLATPIGIGIYAVGDNPIGAYRSGVPATAVRVTAYAVSGALTTFAGLFVAAQTGSGDPVIGTPFTLNSIAAAVLGGVGFLGGQGTMRGALAGSLLLSVMINVMFFLGFPPVAQYIAQGVIIVGAVALPQFTRPRLRHLPETAAVEAGEGGMTRVGALLSNRTVLAYLVVLILWVGASAASRGFGAYGHLRYLLELSAVIGLVSAGQTLVVIGGGIDLSVGAVITVTAIGLPLVSPDLDPTGLVGIVLTLGVAAAIGCLNGLGIAWLRVHPLIMTLAMATLLQGALVIFAGGSAVSVRNPAVEWLGSARPGGIPVGIVLWLAIAAATLLFLHRTARGAQIFALGTNPVASRLSGVDVERTTVMLYTLSGLAAGLAGVLVLGMNRQGYVGIGDPYLLTSIAAVVLGGTSILGGRGTYAGTIAGSVLLVTITALITVVNASPGWRSILFGSLILGLLLISGREDRRR